MALLSLLDIDKQICLQYELANYEAGKLSMWRFCSMVWPGFSPTDRPKEAGEGYHHDSVSSGFSTIFFARDAAKSKSTVHKKWAMPLCQYYVQTHTHTCYSVNMYIYYIHIFSDPFIYIIYIYYIEDTFIYIFIYIQFFLPFLPQWWKWKMGPSE